MKLIAVLCGGSRGDSQPYAALGKGLQRAGYRVRIVTDSTFETLITSFGLEFFDSQQDSRAVVETHLSQIIGESNPIKQMRRLREVRPLLQAAEKLQARAQWLACQGADAIVGHALYTPFGLTLAEKLNIPYFEVEVKPIAPTRAYPLATLPPLPLGSAFNYITHALFEKSMWHLQRATVNRWRRETLDLPSMAIWKYHQRVERSLKLRLVGISPSVIPRPQDWDQHIHMTGYWFLDRTRDYRPTPELLRFLIQGPPPVYVGFGSMPSRDPIATTELVLEALELAGQRGILLGGWRGMVSSGLPDSVLYVDDIPHDWLFPRVTAAVHHGGAGTTAAALRANIPSVVLPVLGDQAFWGRRLVKLGVAPEPISRKKLTSFRLADAIHTATTDQTMRERAADLGEKIRAENGVGVAVDLIRIEMEQSFGQQKRRGAHRDPP